jgi:ribosomal protein S18 acetylase RimI-like enzyme
MHSLEVVRLTPTTVDGLLALLRRLEDAGEAEFFRPHPFTREHLATIGQPEVKDLYYVAAIGSEVAGYGLLRGWEQGYEVPSLGIAIHPEWRSVGLGSTLMHFLHSAARLRGSKRVRLRVIESNEAAIALYRRIGYAFQEEAEHDASGARLLVAYKELTA